GRAEELSASAELAAQIGAELGCRLFNALYGNRHPESTAAAQDQLAVRNLAAVATELARIDGTVLVEPVSGAAAYPLRTADDVIAVLDRDDYGGGTDRARRAASRRHRLHAAHRRARHSRPAARRAGYRHVQPVPTS